MKAIKRVVLSMILSFSALIGNAAHAGIPVIDAANLMQSIQNILAWAEQYEQMMQGYQQRQQQIRAVTGARNLGDILYNPAFRNTVDPRYLQTMQSIQNAGYGGLSAQARALRSTLELYNCSDREGANRRTCEAALGTNAQNMVYQQNALQLLNQRTDQIQALQGRINTTTDPKEIAELQARIGTEQAQIANDANRIQVMNAYSAAQERALQQQFKEKELRTLSLTSDGTDTFVFRP